MWKNKVKHKRYNKYLNKRFILFLVYTIITIVISYSVITVINNGFDDIFGYTVRLVISGSMEPEIKINSISVIQKCDISEVKEGDIVCFSYGSDIIHRVINVFNVDNHTILHTKGDANEVPDSIEISSDMFVGKVVKTYNGAAKIIEKYSIEPGKIDTMSLARNMVFSGLFIGIIVFCVSWLVTIVGLAVRTFTSRSEEEIQRYIDKYINDIDELVMYRDILTQLRDGKGSALKKIARTKAVLECTGLHGAVKDFKKSMQSCLYMHKLGDKKKGVHRNGGDKRKSRKD